MAHNEGIHRFTAWLSTCSIDQKTAVVSALYHIIDLIEDEVNDHKISSSSSPAEPPAQNIRSPSPSILPAELRARRLQEGSHMSLEMRHSENSSEPGSEEKRYQRGLTLARLEGRDNPDLEMDKMRIRSWWLQRVVHGHSPTYKKCYSIPAAARDAEPSREVSGIRILGTRNDRHDSTNTTQGSQYDTMAGFYAQGFSTGVLPEPTGIQRSSESRADDHGADHSIASAQSAPSSSLSYDMLAGALVEELSQDDQEKMSLLHESHMTTQRPTCHSSSCCSDDVKSKKKIRHGLSYNLEGGHLHLYKTWSRKLAKKLKVKSHHWF